MVCPVPWTNLISWLNEDKNGKEQSILKTTIDSNPRKQESRNPFEYVGKGNISLISIFFEKLFTLEKLISVRWTFASLK